MEITPKATGGGRYNGTKFLEWETIWIGHLEFAFCYWVVGSSAAHFRYRRGIWSST